jgi:hypothetical protein
LAAIIALLQPCFCSSAEAQTIPAPHAALAETPQAEATAESEPQFVAPTKRDRIGRI